MRTKPSAISAYIKPIITPLVIRSSVTCQSISGMRRVHGGERRLVGVLNRYVGADRRFAAVLEGDVRDELDIGAPAIERVDHRLVFFADEAAANLAGTRHLVVVGVELLVEQHEAADARRIRQAGVAFANLVADQRTHARVATQILIRAVSDALAFGPCADRLAVDGYHRRDEWPVVAERDRFADERAEFELVLDELRRERLATVELADVLGAIDDHQVAARIDEAGVAGAQPAVCRHSVAGRLRLLVIALEHAGRAHQHLARGIDAHLDAGADAADGIWIGLGVGLQRDDAAQLGCAVNLLEVDAEGAEETERVGAERRATGIGPTHAAQPQAIAHRPVDDELAQRELQLERKRHLLAVVAQEFGTLGDAPEVLEQLALEERCVGRAHLHGGEHVLPYARRRQPGGRPKLAQIALNCVGALWTVARESNHQAEYGRIEHVANPGHRQVAQPFVAESDVLGGDESLGGPDEVAM